MSNAPLVWMKQPPQQPGQAPYYINTVAITANGERVVTGTYYHDYSSELGVTELGVRPNSGSGLP
ncbi:MAG: hypothetical protein AB7V26_02630 [Lysobacterales bacterium]